jgi:hypothetical protein
MSRLDSPVVVMNVGGNDPQEEGEGMYEESGEALTIIDHAGEGWIFHILPDDTVFVHIRPQHNVLPCIDSTNG